MAAASARNIACFALFVSIISLQVPSSCIDQRGTSTTTAGATASAQHARFDADGALQALLALAGMQALFIFAAIIYSHRQNHAAGNWRVSELTFFILCLQVGFLQLFLFAQQPGEGGADDGAHALAVSAARAIPAVASVTFFLGVSLVYAHVGNGGGGAIAGNGPVPAPAGVRYLANLTFGAALVCLTSIVLALYTNTK